MWATRVFRSFGESSSTIDVRRTDGLADYLVRYRLEVDGELVAKIRPGDRVSIPVDPGRHRVRARVYSYSSQEIPFEVAEGQTIPVTVSCNVSLWMRLILADLLYSTLMRDHYLTVRLDDDRFLER